ncbi:hypothetical protein [Roseovarius sp. D0-M9]
MTDLDNLPEPEVLMSEIMENLEAAIEQFSAAVSIKPSARH